MDEVVNVDSKGRCFLCLVNLAAEVTGCDGLFVPTTSFEPGSKTLQRSLSLTRYLKPDVRKVLQQNGNRSFVPSSPIRELDVDLERYHQLKVTLCQECTSANDQFLGLYRQLQQIEMEVKSCLNVIYERMANAEEGEPQRTSERELEDDEECQFANGMRKEVMEKCSLKLQDPAPDNLTEENEMLEEGNYPDCEIEIVMDQDEANLEPEVVAVSEVASTKQKKTTPPVIDIAEDEGGSEPGEGDPSSVKVLFPETARKYQKRPFTIDPVSRLYRCNLCLEQFEKYHPFYVHHKFYHIREKIKCAPCGAEFPNRNAYSRHHQTTHMDLRFRCPNAKCTKTFEDKNGLSIHQQRSGCGVEAGPSPGAKTQKVFECPHCQKHFSRSTTLREHIRIHTGEKPFSCDYCDKSFYASSGLKTHLDRHRDIFHFQCPECKQTFPEKCKLTAHKQRTGHR